MNIHQETIGIFGAFNTGKNEYVKASLLQSFPDMSLHSFSSGLIATSGALWKHYESQAHHLFIDGEIFFRDETALDVINHNKVFAERFNLSLLSSIKGNFNAIVIPKSGENPMIITGALGLKPLFCYKKNGMSFISDDLRFLKRRFPELSFNHFALVQALVFNFPINSTSFLKGVELLSAGMIYTLPDLNNPQKWYDIERSIEGVQYNKKEALELLRTTLNKIIKQYTSVDIPMGLSLTGGFDGRTILSAIPNRKKLYLYTFGSTVSPDIQVARHISEELNFKHNSFFIDQEYYDKEYITKVFEFIMRSNGIGAHERTHYLHAFSEMSRQVKFILSGNGGSEIFRTIKEGGIFVPQLAFELFQTDKPIQTIKHAILQNPIFEAVNFDPLEYVEALYDSWQQLMQDFESEQTSYRGVYRYLLKEAFRKWFGNEMRIEDKYCPNRAPFFDEEMLEAMHQTPFSVAYQPLKNNNPIKRRIGQTPYAHIITQNDDILAQFDTSRNYSPKDLTHWRGLIRVLFSVLDKKRRYRKINDFNQQETNRVFFKHYIDKVPADLPWLEKEKLRQFYNDEAFWQKEIWNYSKLVCLSIWYQNLSN